MDDGVCQFFVAKKNRRCRMQVKNGLKFCGEHLTADPESQRIPCPKDPKHTVNASQLESHLLRCNKRLSSDPWIKENINVPFNNVNRDFKRPTDKEILDVISVIRRIYPKIENEIRELTQQDIFYNEVICNTTDITNEKRTGHLLQLASIIDHLDAYKILNNDSDSCLIDLGSGKAQLIYWLTKKAPRCQYLLVDRKGVRHKFDNKALIEDQSLKITRLRCSIENLDLNQVPLIQKCKSVTAVCKHFCGSAMDAGIRCIENAIKQGVQFNGFAFASCCHHRCTENEFVGLDYLNLNGIESFSAIRHVSTWAVCRFPDADSTEQHILNSEKLELGRQAKKILEFARAHHLRKLGYDVELLKYVDYQITSENLLIVGRRKIE